jgi:TorA maturation chaperone TorD
VKKEKTEAPEAVLSQFRAAFYLLLSRGFSRELDRNALTGLDQISGTLAEAWAVMALFSDPDLEMGQALLSAFFAGIRHSDQGPVVEDLAREYASLFLGVGEKTISPFESVYRSGSGQIFQSAHFEVQQAYQLIGMARNDRFREPDDHIAVELSYMARLCEMSREVPSSDRKRALHYLGLQRDFLDKHLVQWVPAFAGDLVDATRSDFYRAIGFLLRGYTRIDQRLIEMMMQEFYTSPESKEGRRKKQDKQDRSPRNVKRHQEV